MRKIRKDSYVEKVLNYLVENDSIDRDIAMKELGVYNLSIVIQQLKARGYDITERKIKNSNMKRWTLHKVEEPIVAEEPKEQEFWAIMGIYQSTSGETSIHFCQTLFESEEKADEFGQIAKQADSEMLSYTVQKMIKL